MLQLLCLFSWLLFKQSGEEWGMFCVIYNIHIHISVHGPYIKVYCQVEDINTVNMRAKVGGAVRCVSLKGTARARCPFPLALMQGHREFIILSGTFRDMIVHNYHPESLSQVPWNIATWPLYKSRGISVASYLCFCLTACHDVYALPANIAEVHIH